MADRYPQDFCGAAPRRIELVYLSSDEEEDMDTLSTTSVMDLQLSSEDEEYDDETLMMAQYVEVQLSKPIPVPGPSTPKKDRPSLLDKPSECRKPNPAHSPSPIPDQSFFSLGKGRGPIRRDDRIRNNHPIKLCSGLIPLVDTPMSPPPEERGPSSSFFDNCAEQPDSRQSLDGITNLFQGMGTQRIRAISELFRLCNMRKIDNANSTRGSFRLSGEDSYSRGNDTTGRSA